jgi:hypothetical protein
LLFSAEGAENIKKQALRAFVKKISRLSGIDFFLLPSSQRQKKSIFSLRSGLLLSSKFLKRLSEFH